MPESMGEQILVAAAALVAGMTGPRPWGGSYPDDPVVAREYRAPAEGMQTPHIGVVAASGATARIVNISPPMNIEHLFPVTFYGTIAQTQEAVADVWLQRLRDDLMTTVLANASLGGLCSGLGDVISFETDEGEFGAQAQLAMTVTFKFLESKGVG